MSRRVTVQDFMSAVRQRSNGNNNFGATLNSDGSVQITKTPVTGGAAVIAYAKVWYNITGYSAGTDANSNSCDTVTVCNADGSNANSGDAQTFLNTLV